MMSPAVHATAEGELNRDAAWRHTRVAVAAYYIAEHRGVAAGSAGEDWTLAEAQIDAQDEASLR